VTTPIPFYQDDFVVIYHGDWRTVMPFITADVLVTDPPYGYAFKSSKGGRFKHKMIANDDDLAERDELLAAWGDDRPALVFGSWKRDRPAGTRNVLVWHKLGHGAGMGDLNLPWGFSHEEIYVKGHGFTGKRVGSVLEHRSPSNGSALHLRNPREHPNQKPVSLMRDLLEKCQPAWVILDPFMGSGATLRAAKDMGRKAIGIELELEYCQSAARLLGQEVLL
jgi:site-specific DNA-methyltransferase (adenine-specific)